MFRAVVRYGLLRHLAEFSPESGSIPEPRPGSLCVVGTDRGTELGQVLALARERLDRDGAPGSGEGGATTAASARVFLRGASPADLERARESEGAEERARAFGQERAQTRGLALRVVGVERLFSGERLIVYYTAEDRLDLRELARELQAEVGTRVELRQLGARERARACGGTGVCGRALCCSTFLRELEPVTLRMAKVQGFSLSPDATQGVCGRLKCCLRYENPLYEEGRAALPRIGAQVEAARASGEVIALSVLARKVTVRTPDGRLVELFAAEVAGLRTVPRRLPLAPAPEQAPEPPVAPAPKRDSRWRGLTKRFFGSRATPPPPAPDELGKVEPAEPGLDAEREAGEDE